MNAVRRGHLAAAGLALLATTGILVAAVPAPADVPVGRTVVTVEIRDNTYSPASVDVEEGTTVRWVNVGRNQHDVTPVEGRKGYSGSNASGDLYLVNSVWSRNRTGIVPNSFGGADLAPQGMATIAGNVVDANGDPRAARSGDDEFDAALGGGIVIAGGIGNTVTKNRVADNVKVGIALAPSAGLEAVPRSSTGNQVTDNVVQGSGVADLATILPAPDDGNCFSGNTFTTSGPSDIELVMPCSGAGTGDLATGALDIGKFLDTSANPPGRPSRKTPVPPKQRTLPHAASARARPAGAPVAVDVAAIETPSGG